MKTAIKIAAAAFVALAASHTTANAQLLWKVTGNKSAGTSYIFGTHHIAPLSVIDGDKSFKKALNAVDFVITEAPMPDNPQDPELVQLTMAAATAPADSTLSAVLSPAQIDSLNAVLAKYTAGQLSARALDGLKPSMVSNQLAVMQSMAAFPTFNPAEQLDAVITRRAQLAQKPVLALESMEEQLDVLFGAPIAAQAADLMDAVRTDASSADKAVKLANAYLNRDIATVERMVYDDPDTDTQSEMFLRMFNRRNQDWSSRLHGQLQQHPVLVVVGVGHLVGDTGLINSLRRAGYTVEPAI